MLRSCLEGWINLHAPNSGAWHGQKQQNALRITADNAPLLLSEVCTNLRAPSPDEMVQVCVTFPFRPLQKFRINSKNYRLKNVGGGSTGLRFITPNRNPTPNLPGNFSERLIVTLTPISQEISRNS